MIKRKIFVPIYAQEVELYYGTHKELNKVNNHYQLVKFSESCHARCAFVDGPNIFLLLLRNDLEIGYGGVAHECKHLVNFIFIKLGMALDVENDEHECYLLDWLVTQVLSIIKIIN